MSYMAKSDKGFRAWYYFRMGWATYFAFILAAVNTLTVTYFLAIENYPILKEIFPTFVHYIVIVVGIGIPFLTGIGYIHFKRSAGHSSEAGVMYETNPYARRALVNSEIILEMNVALIPIIKKLSTNEKLTEDEIGKFETLVKEISQFLEERRTDRQKDLKYFPKFR